MSWCILLTSLGVKHHRNHRSLCVLDQKFIANRANKNNSFMNAIIEKDLNGQGG